MRSLVVAFALSLCTLPASAVCLRYQYHVNTSIARQPSTRIPQFLVCDLEAELPVGDTRPGDLAYSRATSKLWKRTSSAWAEVGAGGGEGAAWGEITGMLSSQTDLQTALNGKASAPISDGDLPSTIARDTEITSAISTHEGAADPHATYQRESEKGTASGYASLDSNTLVPNAQIATGTPDGTKFLRDDRVWAAPPAGGSGNLLEVDLDFGTSGNTNTSTTVTGQTWVTSSSKIICTPTLIATSTRAEGAEDAIIEGLTLAVHTRVAGTGFTLSAAAAQGRAYGVFKAHCSGS